MDVRPFGMIVLFVGNDRDRAHEPERLSGLASNATTQDQCGINSDLPSCDGPSIASIGQLAERAAASGKPQGRLECLLVGHPRTKPQLDGRRRLTAEAPRALSKYTSLCYENGTNSNTLPC